MNRALVDSLLVTMTFAVLLGTAPIPVHVSDVVRTAAETDWLSVFIASAATVASLAVAGFTYVLALQTRNLARETKSLAVETQRMADETTSLARETLDSVTLARTAAQLTDQHHQESQSPLIVIKNPGLVYNAQDVSAPIEMQLRGTLWNVGFGPALQVAITATPEGGQKSQPFFVGAMEVGKLYEYPHEFFPLSFPPASVPAILRGPRIPGTVTISYRNIFGGLRTTHYELAPDPASQSFVVSEIIAPQELVSRLNVIELGR
jgi:hypothetical protein